MLAPLGLTCLVTRPAAIGFGKAYPEFWINLRTGMARWLLEVPFTSAFARKRPMTSMPFMPPHLMQAGGPMARRACVRTTACAITRPS